jgi:hypothetical protein
VGGCVAREKERGEERGEGRREKERGEVISSA